MAANHLKLTDRAVVGLPLPDTGRRDAWDLILPGFGVRLSARGTRTWIVVVSGNRRTVGKFPAMTTGEARVAARQMIETSTPAPRGQLFEALAERFLAHGLDRRGRPLRSETTRLYRFVLMTAAAPLHGRQVAEITRADIAEVLEAIVSERGRATAALARSCLGRFFNWIISVGALGERERSPVAGSQIYSVEPRKRVLDTGEVAAIWNAPDTPLRGVVRLLLLTGARRSEVGGARWSEFDLEAGIWVVPAERTKNKLPLVLPLPQAALDEINRRPRLPGRDTLFGAGSPRGFTSWGQAKSCLDAAVPLARPWRLHDLRRTFRTRLHKLQVPGDVVRRILNHDLGQITTTYDRHDYVNEMRAALELWAGELAHITSAPTPQVVSLDHKRVIKSI